MSSARGAKERAEVKAWRKAQGLPVRGDAEAGRAKSPFPPKGGRNSRGRGRGRDRKRPAPRRADEGTGEAAGPAGGWSGR